VALSLAKAASESHQLYKQSKAVLAGCLLLSLISNLLMVASFAAADLVLGGAGCWADSLVVGPLVVLANCAPLTPGGLGVAEATASGLFDQFGSDHGAEMMLTVRLVTAALAVPGLFVVLAPKHRSVKNSTGYLQKTAGEASPTAASIIRAA
jgi:uncharacterized membrane protein YbhN (UPF0104 family)